MNLMMSLLNDLHELIASPTCTNSYLDIAVQFCGDVEETVWTSKLSVYFLYPHLKDVLACADRIILPPPRSNFEMEITKNFLQLNVGKVSCLLQNHKVFLQKNSTT